MSTYFPRFLILATAALALPAFNVDSPTAWQAKVDGIVLTEAAIKGEAEFFIYLAQQADVSGAYALETKEQKGLYVYERLTAVANATQGPVRQQLNAFGAQHKAYWIANVVYARGDLDLVEAMAQRSDVARIMPMAYGQVPQPVVESPDTGKPDGLRAPENGLAHIGAPDAWALGYTGLGAVVGGSDTGVVWDHNALKNQYRGWNAIDQVATHDYNWFAGTVVEPFCSDDNVPCDGGDHGTHTIGTMVGDDGGTNQIGIAPDAQWIACRNHTGGLLGDLNSYLSCMQFMLAPTRTDGTDPDPTLAPDAVNNSWSCAEGCGHLLVAPLENSVAAGIFYAASAGNDGPDCSTDALPLSVHEASVSVASTIHAGPNADKISLFSSRGPAVADSDANGVPKLPRTSPDIAAPGSTVRSATSGPNNYGNKSGTSMATPHVAGLAALLVSANPKLRGNVDLILQVMADTAVALYPEPGDYCGDDTAGARPNNTFGWGRIDALAAVQLATADADNDGETDLFDNCTDVFNPTQCNSNAGDDNFGNHCDADLDDNGLVNSFDVTILRESMGTIMGEPYHVADLDCNGVVNSFDLGIMRDRFGEPPGPGSGN